MRILVAYATRYGSTTGIADAIGSQLRAAGFEVDVVAADAVQDPARYGAFVIGSAIYVGHWLKDAADLVRRHADVIAARPTWLFSSGPLGAEETDKQGRPLRDVAAPAELEEFQVAIRHRGHATFFGALVAAKLEFRDRSIRRLPVGRELLPEGDFRDWAEVERWTAGIARDLYGSIADAAGEVSAS